MVQFPSPPTQARKLFTAARPVEALDRVSPTPHPPPAVTAQIAYAAALAKELLRDTYAAVGQREARRRPVDFYQYCAKAGVTELTRLAKTISAWQDEVLAYHTTGLSNGPTEAVNLLLEKVRRIGHGSRNFNTIGYGSYSAAASHGTLTPPQDSEAAHHASSRRPDYHGIPLLPMAWSGAPLTVPSEHKIRDESQNCDYGKHDARKTPR